MGDLAWEFEDPEPVPASHLVRVNCCACGAARAALAAPGHERAARCTQCMGSSPIFPGLAGRYTSASGWSTRQSMDEGVCPVCRATSRKDKCNWMPGGNHPAPSVSSRDAVAGMYPSAVLKLAERAREAGWEVRQQYARGCSVHGSTGRPLAEQESFALVFGGHPLTDEGAYAVHRGGSWKSINIGGRLLGGVSDLLYWLECGGRPEPHWVEQVRGWAEHAEYLKAQLVARNAKIKKEHAAGALPASLCKVYKLTSEELTLILAPKKVASSKKKSEEAS